jgi:hypothetical protein
MGVYGEFKFASETHDSLPPCKICPISLGRGCRDILWVVVTFSDKLAAGASRSLWGRSRGSAWSREAEDGPEQGLVPAPESHPCLTGASVFEKFALPASRAASKFNDWVHRGNVLLTGRISYQILLQRRWCYVAALRGPAGSEKEAPPFLLRQLQPAGLGLLSAQRACALDADSLFV